MQRRLTCDARLERPVEHGIDDRLVAHGKERFRQGVGALFQGVQAASISSFVRAASAGGQAGHETSSLVAIPDQNDGHKVWRVHGSARTEGRVAVDVAALEGRLGHAARVSPPSEWWARDVKLEIQIDAASERSTKRLLVNPFWRI